MLRRFVSLGLALSCTLAMVPDVRAEGTSVATATRAELKRATREFDAANKAFDKGKFDVALTRFKASYGAVKSPNSILMIARCQRELGHARDAYASYLEALSVAEEATKTDAKYQQATADAQDELASFKKEVALLRISLAGGGTGSEVKLGDQTLATADLGAPVVLAPGAYTLTAHAASGATKTEQITLAAGEERAITLDLNPAPLEGPAAPPAAAPVALEAPKSRGGLRTAAYVSGGVGVAGAVVFGVFGAMSKSKFNHLKATCPGGVCAPDQQDDIDAGRQDQTIANVGLVVGALGLGVGVTLFVLSSRHEETARTGVTAAIVAAPDRVLLRGSF